MKTMKIAFMALMMVTLVMSVGFAAGGMESSQSGSQTMGSQAPVKASELMGKNINTNEGQEVGEVKDLVIGQNGDIQYLVVEPSGDLKKEDQLIPLPWHAIQTPSEQQKDLTVAVNMQKLQNAPTITQDQWDNLSGQDIESKLRGYYGSEMEKQQPGMMDQQKEQMKERTKGGMHERY